MGDPGGSSVEVPPETVMVARLRSIDPASVVGSEVTVLEIGLLEGYIVQGRQKAATFPSKWLRIVAVIILSDG